MTEPNNRRADRASRALADYFVDEPTLQQAVTNLLEDALHLAGKTCAPLDLDVAVDAAKVYYTDAALTTKYRMVLW